MLHPLSETLFSEYRRRALGLLLLRPENGYHVREIARLTGTPPGTLHKELSKLANAGILTRARNGNQVIYQADRTCPIFEELASIMRKTSGLADVLAQALQPCSAHIDVAFVFGSVARAQETANSDIDVMIVGTVGFVDVIRQLYEAQTSLGREINPKVLSAAEWRNGISTREPFLLDVQAKPKIFLIGNEHDLAELSGDQSR